MARLLKGAKSTKNKNKIISMCVLGVGLLSMIAVIIMAICGVFDTGEIKPIRSSFADNRVVGKIDGHKVRYEELKYVSSIIKQQYREKYGEDVWETPESAEKYREQFETDVMLALKEIYATLVICDEVGIKENNADAKEYTQAQLEDIIAKDFSGDFDKYKEYLAKNNLTDAFMRFKTKTVYLDLQAKDKMISDGDSRFKYSTANAQEFIDYVLTSPDFFRTIHIYYEKTGDAALDKAKLDEANSIVAELSAISDTDERYEKMKYYIGHNGDYKAGYVTDTRAGLYLTAGVMGEEYDGVATSIAEYDVSIVETEYEYFVVMKMPKEKDDVKSGFTKILAYYHEKIYFDYKNEVIGRIEFKGNNYFSKLDLLNITD